MNYWYILSLGIFITIGAIALICTSGRDDSLKHYREAYERAADHWESSGLDPQEYNAAFQDYDRAFNDYLAAKFGDGK